MPAPNPPSRGGLWSRGGRSIPPLNPQNPIYCGSAGVVRDDGSGTITGTADAIISRPPWIYRHFTQLVCGEASANFTTGAATFGSMSVAKDDLDTLSGSVWASLYRLTSPETPDDMSRRLGEQIPLALFKSVLDGKWKFVVYPTGTPHAASYFLDPAGNNYKWKVGEDFVADSTSVSFTPIDEIVNEAHIRFGLYLPTNTYRYDAWVGPSGSDDGTGTADAASTYEDICTASYAAYGVKNAISIDCDMNPNDPVQAVALRNYIIGRFARPRLLFKFTALSRVVGLEPGMVTLVHNDLQDYLPIPWYPGSAARRNWDDMKFFVRDISFDYTGGMYAHTITLEEIPV